MANRGGKREGAGPPKLGDKKKVQLPIYVEQRKITALSRELCRDICNRAIENELLKRRIYF